MHATATLFVSITLNTSILSTVQNGHENNYLSLLMYSFCPVNLYEQGTSTPSPTLRLVRGPVTVQVTTFPLWL